MKPNPFLVARQPPMKVRGQIVVSSDTREPSSLESETLFDHLVELITNADLVTEGARYADLTPAKFLGSAVMTLRMPTNTFQPSSVRKVSFLEDRRLARLIEARVFTEILRHLSQDAPADFEWQGRETFDSSGTQIHIDFECQIGVPTEPLSNQWCPRGTDGS